MVILTISVVKYIYAELKTYRLFDRNEDMLDAIRKADLSFEDIFTMAKLSTNSVLLSLFLSLFINDIKFWRFLLLVIVGFIIGLIYIVFFERKVKYYASTIPVIKKIKPSGRLGQIGTIMYIFLLISVLSFTLIISAFDSNQEVKMKIEETITVPIEISLYNIDNPIIEYTIHREKNPKNDIIIKLVEEDLRKSIIEVSETKNSFNSFLIKENLNEKYQISENKIFYQYRTKLNKYILDGENLIEISILSNGNMSRKTYRVVTSIYKQGNEILIPQKTFNIKP